MEINLIKRIEEINGKLKETIQDWELNQDNTKLLYIWLQQGPLLERLQLRTDISDYREELIFLITGKN